jgi:hypothetical protein
LVEESMFYSWRIFLCSKTEHAECAFEGKKSFPAIYVSSVAYVL